jgi:hypothetical protein
MQIYTTLSWFKVFLKTYASEILFCLFRRIEYNGENGILNVLQI